MNEPDILRHLGQQPATPDAEVMEYIDYHGEGHFHAWEVRLKDCDGTWILKSPSHEDEERLLFRELALARLGRIFNPCVTPENHLVAVAESVVAGRTCQAERQDEPPCHRPVAMSTAFATQRLGRAYKTTIANLDRESLARIVAFCTWVDAIDSEYVDGLDGRAYSIDHADCLRGVSEWDGTSVTVAFSDHAQLDDGSLRERALYQHFLDELNRISHDAVVNAFAGIPNEWLGSSERRARDVEYLLARLRAVEEAVTIYTR